MTARDSCGTRCRRIEAKRSDVERAKHLRVDHDQVVRAQKNVDAACEVSGLFRRPQRARRLHPRRGALTKDRQEVREDGARLGPPSYL
jgi:hypothetical protein